MRIIFFGSPEFAVPSLNKLFQSGQQVVGIVTQPDTRRGRGNQFSPTPVKEAALAFNPELLIWQPDRLKKDREILAKLAATEADLFVVVAYGQILSQEILDMPKLGCINVHGSLLPKYRGAAPIQWAIANGEEVTGITTMKMDAGIDTGDMLLKASLEIFEKDDAESLSEKLANLGADLLIETLEQLTEITPIRQDDSLTCYSPMIAKEDLQIDWSMAAREINNRLRGFYPNCYTNFRGERLKIIKAEAIADSLSNLQVGQITTIIKNQGFTIKTGSSDLLIKELQPSGKKLQSGWDFANGSRLEIGEILG
jgi:methionyl-tRNA formyltransferase